MIKLFGKIIIVFVLTAFFSLAFDFLYRQTYELKYQFPQALIPFAETKSKYEIVKLGNSHTNEGLTFEKYKLKSLDLSVPNQSLEYDFARLKMYANQIEKNAVILVNVDDVSFSQTKPNNNTNFASLDLLLYERNLSAFLIPHLKLSEYLQVQFAPFMRSGFLSRQEYSKEVELNARRTFAIMWWKAPQPTPSPTPSIKLDVINGVSIERNGLPTYDTHSIVAELSAPPELPDERLIESSQFVVNKWTNTGGFGKTAFASNRNDLQNIIDYCIAHKWRPVLVTLPTSQILTDSLGGKKYLQEYIYDNLKKINTHNIPYINLMTDTRIAKDKYLFRDADHLNNRGASVTSYLLLQKLIKIGYLPKTADGYSSNQNDIKM